MSRSEPVSLLALTQSFFLNYLQSTRGASSHTMRAYRDALKLFFLFLAGHKHKSIADLDLDDVQAEAVLKFLDHIESNRCNSAVTRNCRLAEIRSFVQHLLRQDITRAGQYGRILAIQTKRATQRAVAYLEPEEARAVIAVIDTSSPRGRRDHALLLLLYNTGVLVAEIRSPCGQRTLTAKTSPRDAPHAPPQLRGCPPAGGRRCLGDSRLPCHASVSTTSRYITTNLQMKRQVLDAFWKRAGLATNGTRKWQPSPKLLAFLHTL